MGVRDVLAQGELPLVPDRGRSDVSGEDLRHLLPPKVPTRRVLTLGTFDLLHHGHERLFARCKELGQLNIGVNSDDFVVEYKNVVPADDERTRIAKCSKFGRTWLHKGRHHTPELIKAIAPRYIVVGDDWLERDYLGQLGIDRDFTEYWQVSIVFVPYTRGVSSSELRRAT